MFLKRQKKRKLEAWKWTGRGDYMSITAVGTRTHGGLESIQTET
jgi:hypothetical protein